MATTREYRTVALSLEGTVETPHFDRRAFKARRIFTTLAPDGLTANIRFTPDEQEFRCAAQPDAYRPVPNKWGAEGWTIATLSALSVEELKAALTSAWRYQAAPPKSRAKRKTR
jgi:YjbR